MTTGLRIASDLTLPIDFVTQASAILARKGAGKTYTAKKIVEQVIHAGVPVAVIDPTGAWWGLRSSADGEKPGLTVVIFGGDHGHVPLEPTAGTLIADVVLEHPGAYVLDLSAFPSKASEQRFAADFFERLYRGKKPATGPLLLVVDEADMFAPQKPGKDQLRALGALESIVRRGRLKGLGDLLITQRAAVLNKNVLTQTEILVVMQTTGPQDRAAIDDWIEGNGTREQRDEVLASLASLERGEAWVWSPSFLRILQRVRIEKGTTFDSSRTPEAGEVIIEPKAFAQVDLDRLGERITATAEQAKANDPAELRRQLAEARRDAAKVATPVVERVEVPVLNGQVEDLRKVIGQMFETVDRIHVIAGALTQFGDTFARVGQDITSAIDRVQSAPRSAAQATIPRRLPAPVAVEPGRRSPVPSARVHTPLDALTATDGAGSASLGRAERLILATLATYPEGRTQTQVAILTGYSVKGGGFRNALGRLRSLGFVEGGKDRLVITQAGVDAAGPIEPLPTGRALLEQWLGQLSRAERLALEALAAAYPGTLTQDEVAAQTGYEAGGGGFRNALGKLRTLELITGGKAGMQASPALMDEG